MELPDLTPEKRQEFLEKLDQKKEKFFSGKVLSIETFKKIKHIEQKLRSES